MDFPVPADHKVKLKESEKKKDKYQDLVRELKKVPMIQIVIGALGTATKGLIDTRTGGLENQRMSGDHPNYSIIEIVQNTEKSSGNLRKFEKICSH